MAYVHDRDRSFEDARDAEQALARDAHVVDRFRWEGFDVVVMERGTP